MPKYTDLFKGIAAVAVVSVFVFLVVSCNGSDPVRAEEHHEKSVQVEVDEVKTTSVRKEIELPGRISARRIAQVRARIPGIIISRDFKEGSHVEKGQTLFHIDPAQANARLAQAQAALAKAEASMVDLESTAKRYSKLIETKSISQSEYDTAINNYRAAKANRNAAEAAVKTASLDFSYATVSAPISGRIGRAFVTEGALVGEGEATHLATVQQLNPIYADINQPVSEYLKLKVMMNKALGDGDTADVTVSVDNVDYIAKGKLLFSDITVDQRSGQVSLRSEFPNDDGMLLPGMFVRIKIKLGSSQDVVFVPQRSVLLGADGSAQVYVVDSQSKVQLRSVKTGEMQGSRWQILEGLKNGELVVANGAGKLKPGMTVTVKKSASAVALNNADSKQQ